MKLSDVWGDSRSAVEAKKLVRKLFSPIGTGYFYIFSLPANIGRNCNFALSQMLLRLEVSRMQGNL
jgi:hypothetical protein